MRDPTENDSSPAALIPSVAAWEEFAAGLGALSHQVLEKLAPEWQKDPQIQQEIGRLMLASLAMRAVAEIGDDGDHPVFLPFINQTYSAYQPNADTIYRAAVITPGGTYRLRGVRGSLRIAKISEQHQHPSNVGRFGDIEVVADHDINCLTVDENGCFDVILSPQRPARHDGDWWRLNPRTGALIVRMVASDWSKERDPTLSIERLDAPVERPRPSALFLEERLKRVAKTTANTALLLVDRVGSLRDEGYVNKFKVWTELAEHGGLAGQFYYEAVYDLKEDEALILESQVPSEYHYYSLILTNQIFETTDWYNNHSSLNDSQMRLDSDGLLRVVVSERDPGVPNWMDTAGYPIGVIQGRWLDCSDQPIPTVRKAQLTDVRALLPVDTPRVTPEERETIIRERRAALQQRPLW